MMGSAVVKRGFFERRIFDIKDFDGRFFHSVMFDPLWCDLWRIFKTRGVKWGIERMKPHPHNIEWYGLREARKATRIFHWWTPMWHEGRGPYLSICILGIHLMRGY